jgi:Xaa-Pro dipeptidase
LVTVEPGCYFIPRRINSVETRSKYISYINFFEVEKWMGIGGIRIEDDILVTAEGPQNLTGHIPYLY